MNCHADQILITNGSQEGLTIVSQMLLNPGDGVIMEEPGYRGATQAFRSVSARIVNVKVDGFGLCTDDLPEIGTQSTAQFRGPEGMEPEMQNETQLGERICKNSRIYSHSHMDSDDLNGNIKLLYTTPSHQFPTGGVMPLERRLAMLKWAKRNQVIILEDDYDSEFRYAGGPIESIQGMDDASQTIYMGTFPKIISPVLRTGFLVLPAPLVEPACAIKWTQNRHSALVVQRMLAEYLDSIHFIRHLRRMRKRYSERRTVLIEALKEHLGDEIQIHGTNAGIHLLAWTTIPVDMESNLIQQALDRGLGIYTVTNLYQVKPKTIGLLLGYSNLSNADIRKGVRILANCIRNLSTETETVKTTECTEYIYSI